MKKLSMILTFLVIFGSSAIGHTSEERVVFEGTFERGNTTLFERAISTKRAGHKENGKPVTQFRNFLGSSGEATLKVCNAPEAEKISSAIISINGNVVLGSSTFNQNVGCIEKMVNLDEGDNILAVLLKSKPGGKVSIEISQPDSDDADGYPYREKVKIFVGTEPYPCPWTPYGGIAISHLGDFVYVTNYNDASVSVIDTATNTGIDTDTNTPDIDPITVGSFPVGVSLTHDSTRAYVANSGEYMVDDGTVSVIDTATNTLIDTDTNTPDIDPITVGSCPFGISMLHGSDRDYAYVSDFCSNKVYVIDTVTNMKVASIDVGAWAYPLGISVSPKGGRAYVANFVGGTVSVIDTATNTLIDTDTSTPDIDPITVGIGPWGISVTPDGARAYVANSGSGTVSVIDTASNTLIDTDLSTDDIDPITVGNGPAGISVTPNGAYAYVNNSGDGTVSVIDTTSNSLIDTDPITEDIIDPIAVGKQPKGGIAVSPNGEVVYVGNYEDGTVSVIGF
jgi:YVTN family beta-propeller protein